MDLDLGGVYYFIHSVLRRVASQAIDEFQVDYVACAVRTLLQLN